MPNRLLSLFSALVLCLPAFAGPLQVVAQDAGTDAADPGLPRMAAPPHLLAPHFFGVNIENSYTAPPPSWTDPAWLNAIRKVGIQAVRYPGGDAGNYWDWQTGTDYPRGNAVATDDSLSDLARLHQATGAVPIYNLNVMSLDNEYVDSSSLSSAIENQMQMLSAASSLGLPVDYLELGNEFFWTEADDDTVFPTAADYASTMDEWTARLRSEYPDTPIAAVASIPYATDPRTKTWNAAVIGKVRDTQAVTLHRYESIIDGGMWDGTSPDAVPSYAFTDWESIEAGELKPVESHGLRAWITEFGGFADCTSDAHFTGTWLEGLYQSEMAIQFLSNNTVDQIDLYNIMGSTSSLIFQNSSSYWDSCLSKNITFHGTPGELTATGQAYALFGSAIRDARSVYPVTFPDAPVIDPGSGVAPYPSLTGIAFTGEGKQWILVNLGPKPITLSYPAMGDGVIESLSAPSLTTVVSSEKVLTHSSAPFCGRDFTIPAYSVNRIVTR
jgi:hypothetical protein